MLPILWRAEAQADLAAILVSGTRELVAHPNYIVVYRVGATVIEIVSILHSRQQYP